MRNTAREARENPAAVVLAVEGGYQAVTFPPYASVVLTHEASGYAIGSLSVPAGLLVLAAEKYSKIAEVAE